MILTRDGKEITAIYKQDGSEIEEVKDANGRIVYLASREITGTLPLYFSSKGKPLTDYLISGNTIQDGTPTPTAPITPSGCGERTKNLFDKDNADITHLYPLQDGTTFDQGGDNIWSIILPCKPNTTYTLSKDLLSYSNIRHRVSGSEEYPTAGSAQTFMDNVSDTVSGDTLARQIFTTTATTHWIVCLLLASHTYEELLEQLQSLQLEEANDKTAYEPYGYKIPFTVNGTEYPIYLGQVPTTRRIKKLVLTGEENWRVNPTPPDSHNVMSTIVNDALRGISPICTHYIGSTDYQWATVAEGHITTSIQSGNYIRLAINVGAQPLDDFVSFLAAQYAAGAPVTIWYTLAEPETGIVNEPLHKIGDYADTISYAQTGVTIPTVYGANVLDMPSTVKPSEVYIKGKGIKPTGYGQLVDKNGVRILDKNGNAIFVNGQ